jgi:DNA repair photolyase
MRRFTGHAGERWGSFLDVKINAPEVLEKELSKSRKQGLSLLGSVTDAYQAMERKYGLTRRVLEVLLKHDWPVSILTKSDLVTRDIDILQGFSECEIGLTVTSLNNEVSRNFEPGAPLPGNRLEALRSMKEAGLKTYAFVGPILPGLTDIEELVSALAGKVDYVMFETLNMGAGTANDILRTVKDNYPSLTGLFEPEKISSDWDANETMVMSVCEKYSIPVRGIFKHG